MCAEDPRGRGRLVGDQHGSGGFRAPPGGIGMKRRTREEGQVGGGVGKGGLLGAQAHPRFLEPWGQAARQEAQCGIAGGKARQPQAGQLP